MPKPVSDTFHVLLCLCNDSRMFNKFDVSLLCSISAWLSVPSYISNLYCLDLLAS